MTDEVRNALRSVDAYPHDPQVFLSEVRRRAQQRRNRRLLPVAAGLAVLTIVVTVTAIMNRTAEDRRPQPATAAHPDPALLVGSWHVTPADGSQVLSLLLGRNLSLFLPCGLLTGEWRADPSGLFLGAIYSSDRDCSVGSQPSWLRQAQGFQISGQQRLLVNASGLTVATLIPGPIVTTGPNGASSQKTPLTVEAARGNLLRKPQPLPAGVEPAKMADLVGHWIPEGYDRQIPSNANARSIPKVTFNADGTWNGSDGCNGTGGGYVIGGQGSALTTDGVRTLAQCSYTSPVLEWIAKTRRTGFVHGAIVLYDANATLLGTLASASG